MLDRLQYQNSCIVLPLAVILGFVSIPSPDVATAQVFEHAPADPRQHEFLDDPPGCQLPLPPPGVIVRPGQGNRGSFSSVQVNVDADGLNIPGDAANEPSIAVNPLDPNNIIIAWRQFDTVLSNFRQAGYAYSFDRGQTWTSSGVLDPGQFRSDPVLAVDATGKVFFSSLSSPSSVEVFTSIDGGVTWSDPVSAFGGDKQWLAVDRTVGIGSGNAYQIWNVQFSCCGDTDFSRSVNGALSFDSPVALPLPKMKWGTLDPDQA